MPDSGPIGIVGDPAPDSLTGTIAGRFEIENRVGTGGMGEVYRAQDTRLKCAVALKRLSPALRNDALYRRRLMEEAQRAVRLRNDPRVAAVYDVLETKDEIFLIMEFVEGETLRQRLSRPIQLQEFLNIASQCAEALLAANERGILHGDIKPENIMLTPAGQVKILDFGVAKQMVRTGRTSDQDSDRDNDETVDRAGTFAGTPAYMAPEILLHQPADGRADIFSLGIVFYEALTGRHPFRADSFSVTSDRIRGEKPEAAHRFNPDVSPALDSILQRMLAKKPADRYPDAGELLADLDHLQSGLTPTRLLRLLPQRQTKASVRKGFLAGAAVAVVLAGLLYVPQIRRLWTKPLGLPVIHLVVLPLRPSSTDSNERAFSDGLSEALALWLGQFGDKSRLDVVPPSEVRAESVQNVEQARKSFGATRVLEGTLSQSASQTRVIYTLIDATTGHTLGGNTVTVSSADRLEIEDRLVASVAGILGMEPKQADRAQQGTHEPAAYDYYLLGRGYLVDYHKPENVDSAIAVFKNALELDPNYARAYAGLGQSYWRKYGQTQARSWVPLAKSACMRAVELDDKLAAAHSCLGVVSNGTGDYQKALEEFRQAIVLDPGNDDALLGLAGAFEQLGRAQEAESYFKKAIDLKPQYWGGYTRLGNFYFAAARYPEAEAQYRRVTELVPEGAFGCSNLGAAYLAEGRYVEAVSQFEKSLQLQPNATGYSNLATSYFFEHRFEDAARTYENAVREKDAVYWQWGNLAEAYAQIPVETGKVQSTYRKASELVSEVLHVNPRDVEALTYASLYQAMMGNRQAAFNLLAKIPSGAPRDPELWSAAAKIHYHFGLRDQALDELQRAVAAGYPRPWVKDDPAYAGLASNLQFQRVVK